MKSPSTKRLFLAARVVYYNNPGPKFHVLDAHLTGSPVHLPKRINIDLAQEVPYMIVAANSLLPTLQPPAKADKRPANVEGNFQLQEGEERGEHPIPTDNARREC